MSVSNCLNEQHWRWVGIADSCLISAAAAVLCTPENGTFWSLRTLRAACRNCQEKGVQWVIFLPPRLTHVLFFSLASLFFFPQTLLSLPYFLGCFINNHPFEPETLIPPSLTSIRLRWILLSLLCGHLGLTWSHRKAPAGVSHCVKGAFIPPRSATLPLHLWLSLSHHTYSTDWSLWDQWWYSCMGEVPGLQSQHRWQTGKRVLLILCWKEWADGMGRPRVHPAWAAASTSKETVGTCLLSYDLPLCTALPAYNR